MHDPTQSDWCFTKLSQICIDLPRVQTLMLICDLFEGAASLALLRNSSRETSRYRVTPRYNMRYSGA